MSGLLGNSGLKHHLQQQITQFIADIIQIAALNGVSCLIGFLDRVGGNRLEGLFDIPWASGVRVAQLAHDIDDPAQRRIGAGGIGGNGSEILHCDSVERYV